MKRVDLIRTIEEIRQRSPKAGTVVTINQQSDDAREMEDWPLPSVLKMLLRAMSRLQDFGLLRLQVKGPTFLFLHRLAKQCDHSAKPLGRFLALISASDLADEIIRDLLPAEFKGIVTELDRIQSEKEVAIGIQDCEHAAALRDQGVLLKDQARQACPNPIDIQPEHILQAIARLGYDQPITG